MTKAKEEGRYSKSPFRDQVELETEISDFILRFKTVVVNQATRISDFFEMSCVNHIVKVYEVYGYKVNVKNLQGNKYRYKCSTSGIQSNFSHFEIKILSNNIECEYEIHHNLAVQSSHDDDIVTTPDISIIKKGTVELRTDYYELNKKLSFVKNINLVTFCEVKQFTPFPELLFNFIGVVNEIKEQIVNTFWLKKENLEPKHLAPCLMISGKPNRQTLRIKASLEKRYNLNIIYDLFYSSTITFSKKRIRELVLKKQETDWDAEYQEYLANQKNNSPINPEDLPF